MIGITRLSTSELMTDGEGKPHHERNGELDQAAPHQEILELLQQRLHCLLLGPGRKLRS
jgi:hypothetical protein